MKRVHYIFPISHHYRLPFHERLRAKLADHDIDYRVIYSNPPEQNRQRGDAVDIPWGIKVPLAAVPGTGAAIQLAIREVVSADLVIIQQENKLLLNYLCNAASMMSLKRVAYFGHGRNFQARDRSSPAERWKRFWATRCDWWFGYTEETKNHVVSLGFPAERVTVFNNAVDTGHVKKLSGNITVEQMEKRRRELGIVGSHVGVFVGGIYADKRPEFLIEAADRIRAIIPDFELLIIGGGPQFELLKKRAYGRPWTVLTGPRFGADKIELMRLGQLFLMPGLVGLAILDAAAVGLPTITTAFPYHSPEIAYLEDGVNGLTVRDWESPQAYAEAVSALLLDPARLEAMSLAAKAVADRYTVEAMADRFADGVVHALQ